MPREQKIVERFLEVGCVAVLHTEPHRKDGPRFRTVLRGWRKPQHLMMDRPKTNKGTMVSLLEGQNCVIRFLYEGRACAFDSQVLDWDTRRHNAYLRVRWPAAIDYVAFRKYERVRLNVPGFVVLNNGQPVPGEVSDVSLGGCGMLLNQAVPAGACVKLSFTLPDGTNVENVDVIVRNSRETPGSDLSLLGLQFLPGQQVVENDVAFFVTSSLERFRLEQGDEMPPRILVVDDNEDQAAVLKENFEAQGYSVVLANNVVDALHRMRMSTPLAVLIQQGLEDLPGVDLCRIVKRNRTFSNTPVFVYAGSPELGEQVTAAGGNGHFPPSEAMCAEIAFEVSRQVTQAQARLS